jgi:hypothetical protein
MLDGKTLKNMLYYLVNEPTGSGFIDEKTSFDFLYEAALEYNRLTETLHGTQTITTTADTSAYYLNPDFQGIRLYDTYNNLLIKFYDTSAATTQFIPFRPYEHIYQALNTTPVEIPTNFSITDGETVDAEITGSCTTDSSESTGGPKILTDSAGTFTTTYSAGVDFVSVGDTIHNLTDGSCGVILNVVSTTVLHTSLFYGTDNDWDSSDNYVIIPQIRKKLILDPPNNSAGDTITVLYVRKPAPVYTDRGIYPFDSSAAFALTKYAAWLFKYRDREPNFGDALYKAWVVAVTAASSRENKSYDRNKFRVNFIKRSYWDRSYR